jgi:hypothetical protein
MNGAFFFKRCIMASSLSSKEQQEMDRLTKQAAETGQSQSAVVPSLASQLTPKEQQEMDRLTKQAAETGQPQSAVVPESKGPPSNPVKYLKSRFLTGANDALAVVDVYEVTENKIRTRAEAFLDEALSALMALFRVPFDMVSEIVDSVLDFVNELLGALVDAINSFLGSLPFDLAGLLFGGGSARAGLEGSGAGLEITLDALGYASLDLLWDFAGETIRVNPAHKDTYDAAKKTLEHARKQSEDIIDETLAPLNDALNESAEAFVMGALAKKMIEGDMIPPLGELFDSLSSDAIRDAVAIDAFPTAMNPLQQPGPDPRVVNHDPSEPVFSPPPKTIPAQTRIVQRTINPQDTSAPPEWMRPPTTLARVGEPNVTIDPRFLSDPILNPPTPERNAQANATPTVNATEQSTPLVNPIDPQSGERQPPDQHPSLDTRVSFLPKPVFDWTQPAHPAYQQPDAFESYREGLTPSLPDAIQPGYDAFYERLSDHQQTQYTLAQHGHFDQLDQPIDSAPTTKARDARLWSALKRPFSHRTVELLQQHTTAASVRKRFPGLIPMCLYYYTLPSPLENPTEEYNRLIGFFNWLDPDWLKTDTAHTQTALLPFALASDDAIALFALSDDHTLLNEILISASYRYTNLRHLLKTQYPHAAL